MEPQNGSLEDYFLFRISHGSFLGSMLIFQGVYEYGRCIYMHLFLKFANFVGINRPGTRLSGWRWLGLVVTSQDLNPEVAL